MAKGDRTKWDYFLNMQWSEFSNYSLLFNEQRKDIADSLNACKTFEAYVMKAMSLIV